MAVALGRTTMLGLFKEANYNEAWATGSPTFANCFYINPDFKLKPSTDPLKAIQATGLSVLTFNEVAKGVHGWTLSFSGILPKERLGYLFYGLMGKVASSGSTNYTHVFTPSTSAPPSFKVLISCKQIGATYGEWRLSGGMIKSIEVQIVNNKEATLAVEMIGGTYSHVAFATTLTAVLPASPINAYYWCNDSNNLVTMLVNSNTHSYFQTVTIKIEQALADGVEESYNWGSPNRVRLERASSDECLKFSVKAVRTWSDETAANDFITVLPTSGFVEFTARLGVTSETSYGLTFNFGTRIISADPSPQGAGIMREEIELEGLSDTGVPGSDLVITLLDKWSEPITAGS